MLHHLQRLFNRLNKNLDSLLLALNHAEVLSDLSLVHLAHFDPFSLKTIFLSVMLLLQDVDLIQVLLLHFLHFVA